MEREIEVLTDRLLAFGSHFMGFYRISFGRVMRCKIEDGKETRKALAWIALVRGWGFPFSIVGQWARVVSCGEG